jgi:hypothetical protein
MNEMEALKLRLARIPNLIQISPQDAVQLKSAFPGLPDDYVKFLETTGFGNLQELQIYSGPVKPTDIFGGGAAGAMAKVLLFGDDFQGYCFGFKTDHGFTLVEVDPRGNLLMLPDHSLLAFLQRVCCAALKSDSD